MPAIVPIVLGIALATIVAVLLGIAAIVVYFTGARPDKPWGTPLLVLLVIGAVVAVFAERLDVGRRRSRGRRRFESATLIGMGLRGKIEDGANVVIFRHPVPSETMPGAQMPPPSTGGEAQMPAIPTVEEQVAELKRNWKRAIENGSGVSINIIACEVPQTGQEQRLMIGAGMPGDAGAFSAILEQYRDQGVDAWISFVGVPRTRKGRWDLHNLSSNDWEDPPVGAAELGDYYDPELVRSWIREGLLDVATIRSHATSPAMEVITRKNLDALPEQAPTQMGPPSDEGGSGS